MKIFIAYESKFGNGKGCMEYLQDVMSKKGHDVEMLSVREIEPTSLPSADLYIFSSPTQIGSLAGKMKKFLKKLEISQEGAKYALVTTCMNPPNTKSLKTMEKLLQSRDLSKVSDGLMIKVTGMKGPLESGYEEKLDTFAEDILKAIK
jgi:menaquinone-dependent protoporphyrinogen IX oxidase